MLSPKEMAKKHGVSVQTIRRWEKKGKVTCLRTVGGHRRFQEVHDMPHVKDVVLYARVSTSKQRDDLERQITTLQKLYPDAKLFSDIASGINWRRRGLQSLMREVFECKISEIVIAHRDRLCRFAFPLLEWIFQYHDCKIRVIDNSIQTKEQELADDLLSIVQIFCCIKNGQRANKKREPGVK